MLEEQKVFVFDLGGDSDDVKVKPFTAGRVRRVEEGLGLLDVERRLAEEGVVVKVCKMHLRP